MYPTFSNIFSIILKFPRSFSEYSTIFFFQNFNEYYTKLIPFSNFHCTFSTVPQSLIDIYQDFLQISLIFFQRFTLSFDKIIVEVCSNFYYGLLKIFPASFGSDLNFFLTLKLFFSNN